jgi:6,7-dimethyl-8-ribityllumazine synthase
VADVELTPEQRELVAGSEFAVCVADFYPELAQRLVNGAVEGFAEAGVSPASVHEHRVPGAFELPLAAKWCAESGGFAGVACLGAVIRGETDHYEHVCTAAARGIQDVSLSTGIPCAFGVITADSMDQALARAGGEKRNQGRDAALAVLRMHALGAQIGS